MIIVFNHLRFDADHNLKAEIAELYDLFQPHHNRLIIATDNSNYDLLTKTEGRQTENFFSKNFKRQKLGAFSPGEFESANDQLITLYVGGIIAGGSFSGEYRNPSIWRLLALALKNERTSPNTIGVIDAVPNLRFLKLINTYLHFDPQTVQDFRDLTKAYLEAIPVIDTNNHIQLMAGERVSRITWNELDWVMPSGVIGKSKAPALHEAQYGYGGEEWLFDTSRIIEGYHYSFLEPINKEHQAFEGRTYHIHLYTIDTASKARYWIGLIRNAKVLTREQPTKVKQIYQQKGWLLQMKQQIEDVEDNSSGFMSKKPLDLFNLRFKPTDLVRDGYPVKISEDNV